MHIRRRLPTDLFSSSGIPGSHRGPFSRRAQICATRELRVLVSSGHSVLIATNGKELAALQALGERNYVQFTIQKSKSKQPQKVGDVGILLKNADPKKNRFTIELTADDKTTEKRDRGVNEPLQFMTSKAKQPYELVVNDVKKDTIVGYLSIPKVLNTRN